MQQLQYRQCKGKKKQKNPIIPVCHSPVSTAIEFCLKACNSMRWAML